jgi:GAF domain-containing protein
MRKRVAIYGATHEALQLVAVLESNPDIEITSVFDPDLETARRRIEALDPDTSERLRGRLSDDTSVFQAASGIHAVIDAGLDPPFGRLVPDATLRGVQIVSPLTARLLWGYGVSARDRKGELLQALHEVVDSVNLTIDTDELFSRMLEIAMGVTGADGGSLMLLDPKSQQLAIRVAFGVEPELWPKIKVALGEGIAGRAAAEARPIRLRGRADRQRFQIVRDRLDVESALCVPLVHEGQVLGVLNLHHRERPDAFSDDDLEFAEQLGRLDAAIIARAQEHEALRSQAARYDAVREVRQALSGSAPFADRLNTLCGLIAERLGGGIATVYLHDPDEGELRLAATSLQGGGFGGEYRVVLGQGVDGLAAQSRSPAFLRGEDGALAYSALPLLAGDSLLGALTVQGGGDPSRRTGERFGRALEETLLEIAAAAADEIAQAKREAQMSIRATRIGAINETGIRLISARDLNEVASLATSSAALILEADHAIVRLQDPESRRYVIRSYYGAADGRLQEKLFRLDKQLSVDVIKGRSARLIRNIESNSSYGELGSAVRSAMVAPLKREGRIIGILGLYDKVAPDQFYAGSFNDDDLQTFTKYVHYVERAVTNALFYAHTREHRSFDEETGLPNADYLSRRLDQEIARAGGREGALGLAVCRIENLDEVRRAGGAIRAERVVLRTAEALRTHLRDFDILGRLEESEFAALLPEPGLSPEERITALARAVADEIAKDDRLNHPVRVALAFGYAVHPSEGNDRESLLKSAAALRIRMV